MNKKPIIYQILPRLYTNFCPNPVPNGTLEQNGSGKLNDITTRILRDIRALGVTHVWYTGVIEHAHVADYSSFGITPHNRHIVKGQAGSPYAITDYYDIDPDLALHPQKRMAEFEALIRRTHRAGLKAIIDFVPNHLAREYNSDAKPADVQDFGETDNKGMFFSPSNNFYYITGQEFAPQGVSLGTGPDAYSEFPARATGNDCFTASPSKNDWYETVKLNYGIDPWNGSKHFNPIPSTWHKMLNILLFWAAKGVDGFRCDMAHMVPVEFWAWAIGQVKSKFPSLVFIAEIYDIALYRSYIDAGFDYLYDKVNLYDTLRAIECFNIPASRLTSCWQTVDGLAPRLLNFLENHDEQRFASRQYAADPWRVFPSLVVSSMMSTGPFMLYFGQELGEPASASEGYSGFDGRTTIFDYWSLESVRNYLNNGKCPGAIPRSASQLRQAYAQILRLCNDEKAIAHGSFFDLMYANTLNPHFNPHRQFAFIRAYGAEVLFVVVNFDVHPAELRINIPQHAFDFLHLPSGMVETSQLLSVGINGLDAPTSQTVRRHLTPDHPFTASVPPHGAVVWKLHEMA